MKFLKSLVPLLFALAMAMSCKDDIAAPVADDIILKPGEVNTNFYAQDISTTVTGAEKWELEGEVLWIRPSATSGRDGDVLTLSIEKNMTGKLRVAEYVIKSKTGSVKFVVKQTAGEYTVNLNVEALKSEETSLTVKVICETEDLAAFTESGIAWSEGTDLETATLARSSEAPSLGGNTVQISGLETDKVYNVWGYAADRSGDKIWSETYISVMTGDGTLRSTPVVNPCAYKVKFEMNHNLPGFRTIGVCYGTSQSPDIDDSSVSVSNPSLGMLELTTTGMMEPSTKYYGRVYGVNTAGETLYGPEFEFETLTSPLAEIMTGERNLLTNYYGNHNNSEVLLSTEYQQVFDTDINNAFLEVYGLSYLYPRNMLYEVDGQLYMFVNFFLEDRSDIGDYDEANGYGGLVFKVNIMNGNECSFEPSGFFRFTSDRWVGWRRGEPVNTFEYKVYYGLEDRSAFDRYTDFWSENTFMMDWADSDKTYINMYSVGDPQKLFNFYLVTMDIEDWNGGPLEIHPFRDEALSVYGPGTLTIEPGKTVTATWKVSSANFWNVTLEDGGTLGDAPDTRPVVRKSGNVVTLSYTAPEPHGKFRREWTLVISAGNQKYYSTIFETSNIPHSNDYAVHSYYCNPTDYAVKDGVYSLVAHTEGYRWNTAYNGQGVLTAVWDEVYDRAGQGLDEGKRILRTLPQFLFDIKSSGHGTWYIRPFGCEYLGLGIFMKNLVVGPEYADYEWMITPGTHGWSITSPDGEIGTLEVYDEDEDYINLPSPHAFHQFIIYFDNGTYEPENGQHIQLYLADVDGE